ncbi:MAG: hypothetical protein RJQ21_14625, partial [Rhodospirillales bacterium]
RFQSSCKQPLPDQFSVRGGAVPADDQSLTKRQQEIMRDEFAAVNDVCSVRALKADLYPSNEATGG